MKVLVCGGRYYADREKVFATLDAVAPTSIAQGGASGADMLATDWADDRLTEVETYPADWKAHGPSAGPRRNQRMLDTFKPDLVVAFPGGAGTADMVRRARSAGVAVREVAP